MWLETFTLSCWLRLFRDKLTGISRLSNGVTAQDTAKNRAALAGATELDNASDEALIGNIIDPLIGCKPWLVNSLDDPGAMVTSLATQELQAGVGQQAPVAFVPINDPDCLLTASATTSDAKTNAYRLGVNQPPLAAGADSGLLAPYCTGMMTIAPGFFQTNMAAFSNAMTPAAGVGNNLFTFMCNRYLMSLKMLGCPMTNQTVTCTLDGNGAATACTIGAAATNATAPGAPAGPGGPVTNATAPVGTLPMNGTIAAVSSAVLGVGTSLPATTCPPPVTSYITVTAAAGASGMMGKRMGPKRNARRAHPW